MAAAPRGSQERQVIDTFDAHASTWAEVYEGATSRAHKFTMRRRRVYELAERAGGRMLDVGCGPGVTVDHFVRLGFEFYGVDAAPNAIAECTRQFAPLTTAHFSVGHIDALAFPDGFFDVVTCMGVIQYLDDPDAAIHEMARVCKPGGLVIVSMANRSSLLREWNRTMARGVRRATRMTSASTNAIGELGRRTYREGECRRLLASHGLDARRVVYCNFEVVPFPLDRLMPALTVAATRRLEFLAIGPLRWMGSEFVVQAIRR